MGLCWRRQEKQMTTLSPKHCDLHTYDKCHDSGVIYLCDDIITRVIILAFLQFAMDGIEGFLKAGLKETNY